MNHLKQIPITRDKLFLNNDGKLEFNGGDSNVEWNSNFDESIGEVAKCMARLLKA